MNELLFPEWRDSNERINFPFSDAASLVNSNGARIERDLFDDARVYPVGAQAGMYLSRISVTALEVSIFVGTLDTPDMASVTFQIASPPDDLYLEDAFGRPAGVLVSNVDKLGNVAGLYGFGNTLFEPEQTEFDASVIVPSPQSGLTGILLDDGTLLTGDVYLVGENGIVLRLDDDGNIRIDVIGDPYALVKACDEAGVPVPGFCGIKTINDIGPNAHGDFKLFAGANVSADNILRVSASERGIVRIQTVGAMGFPDA